MRSSSLQNIVAHIFGLSVVFLAISLISSCASGPPEILGVEWTLESRPATNQGSRTVQEDLSVFARVHDSEGLDDIEAMWVINDASELCWTLGPSSWTKRSLGSDDWLGASGLSMPDGLQPPMGRYRLIVADLAGNRAIYEFTIGESSEANGLPSPDWKDGRISLAKAWPENYLLVYDASGSLLRSAVISMAGGSLASIAGSADAARAQAFAIYGYDAASRRGAFSKRIPIR